MNKLKAAEILAKSFHYGQVDKGGYPYINHPIFVSKRCKTKTAKP